MGVQRQPELHDQLYGEHRGGLRHRLGQPRALEPRGRAEGRIHPHPGQGRRHLAELLQPLPQRERLLCPDQRRGLLAHRPVCPHDRAPALLEPQPAAVPDLGLHLPDGKPRTRPGLQAGHQPDAGAQAQVHPHGRHDDPARRDTADDTPRRGRPGAPVPGVVASTRRKTITSRPTHRSSSPNGGR